MRRAYADIPAGQMHYRYTAGGKPPVICLHISGSGSGEYERVGDMLADKFTVYALDMLGMNFSDPPPRLYSLSEHASTVVDFMDKLALPRVILIGTLCGANIATHVAAGWPDRVSKLILAQPVHMPEQKDMHRRKALYDPVQYTADGSYALEFWRRVDKYGYPPAINMPRVTDQILSGPEYSEILHWAMFADEDLAGLYPKIQCPTTVLRYELYAGSPEGPYAGLVASMIPGAGLDTILGETIYASRSNPVKVAAMLRKHL
ncbi:MAG: alpha/beta hydrolase [Peptococcaceae bacterium]|nr:alpha/beta hydrolase [Peptococcaceae bacterium]